MNTEQLVKRFINRFDCYNEQYKIAGGKVSYALKREPVTELLIRQHLAGMKTLSIPALSTDQTCKWICWDNDQDDEQLDKLQALMYSYGWRTLKEGKRPGRDGHLWCFFNEPMPADMAIYFGKIYSRAARLKNVEFFPKQAKAEIGSAMRLPLGVHQKKGAGRSYFIEGSLQENLEWFNRQQINRADYVTAYVEAVKALDIPPTPTRQRRTKPEAERHNILELIPEYARKRQGRDWVTQCPACREAGTDTHADNLRITPDGSKFCCVEQGIAQTHKAKDIIRALLKGA